MGDKTKTMEFVPPPQSAMVGRAYTPTKKEEVIGRLLRLWLEFPQLRLGQLIGNVVDAQLYYVEDFELIEILEHNYLPVKVDAVKTEGVDIESEKEATRSTSN